MKRIIASSAVVLFIMISAMTLTVEGEPQHAKQYDSVDELVEDVKNSDVFDCQSVFDTSTATAGGALGSAICSDRSGLQVAGILLFKTAGQRYSWSAGQDFNFLAGPNWLIIATEKSDLEMLKAKLGGSITYGLGD